MAESIEQQIDSAWQLRREGNQAGALARLSAIYQQARRSQDARLLLAVAGRLAHVLTDLEQLEEAEDLYQQALNASEELGDDCQRAYFLRHQADLWRRCGRGEATCQAYQEAMALIESCGGTDSLELANTMRGKALWHEQQQQTTPAIALWQSSRDIYLRYDIEAGVAEADAHLSQLNDEAPKP
jgi:tetratricopeptide (TPR) repeat protein